MMMMSEREMTTITRGPNENTREREAEREQQPTTRETESQREEERGTRQTREDQRDNNENKDKGKTREQQREYYPAPLRFSPPARLDYYSGFGPKLSRATTRAIEGYRFFACFLRLPCCDLLWLAANPCVVPASIGCMRRRRQSRKTQGAKTTAVSRDRTGSHGTAEQSRAEDGWGSTAACFLLHVTLRARDQEERARERKRATRRATTTIKLLLPSLSSFRALWSLTVFSCLTLHLPDCYRYCL